MSTPPSVDVADIHHAVLSVFNTTFRSLGPSLTIGWLLVAPAVATTLVDVDHGVLGVFNTELRLTVRCPLVASAMAAILADNLDHVIRGVFHTELSLATGLAIRQA